MHELKIGQAVSFRVNGYPQREFAGTVRRIDAAANATTRQVEVLVGFADPAAAPRVAGLFAEGRVETGGAQVLMLPDSSLVREGEAAFVWRVSGQAVGKVQVKLGERDPRSGQFPVLAGVAAGERILRSPGSALVDGQKFAYAPLAAQPGVAGAASAAAASPPGR
jgi:multidrug efflux pump subunit AcrA (membrane-fusion protein)